MSRNVKCILTYDEAVDMAKSVIGVNAKLLQTENLEDFIKARDGIAQKIIDNLSNKRIKLLLQRL